GYDVGKVGVAAQLVGLLAEEEGLARAGPVVGEPGDLAPARPRELEPHGLDRRYALRLSVLRPAEPDERVRPRIDRRLEEHRSPGLGHAVEHPEKRQMVDRVV